MRKILFAVLSILTIFKLEACDHLDLTSDDLNVLMGKKSKFYDAYKQGKCVFEDALSPFTLEQRKLIANLIAKSYKENKIEKYIKN